MISEGINTSLNSDKINPNLKAPALDLEGRKPSMMLSGEDVKKLIEAPHSSRYRALIAMMYEGSLRPIEVISATWSDLNFDQYGAKFTTSKKTRKDADISGRSWRLRTLAWKNDHPKPDPDMPVFL